MNALYAYLMKTLIPALSALVVLGCFLIFSGCYTLSQGLTMLGYLRRAVSLEELTDPDSRRFAEQIVEIRAFAIGVLGLRDTANYTRFVELDRDYLANVVSASAKDSFTPYEWRFPIVGNVPYKGFFDEAGAHKEAEKLKKKDLDVLIRRVDAFSTLGWFSDPLYSYMKKYPFYQIAELIMHETLHATVYLKGESQFNEELAEFVGREGARLFIERKFGKESAEYRALSDAEADNAAFVAFVQDLTRELEGVFALDIRREEKLARKETLIAAYQARFLAEYDARFKSGRYRFFAELSVNNAYLELFRLYYAGGDYLKELFERAGNDLPRFIEAAKKIKGGKKGKPPREQLSELVLTN
jgi:predicted aminopeptidase